MIKKIQAQKQILCSQSEARPVQPRSLNPISTNSSGTVWWSLSAWNLSNCHTFSVLNLKFSLCMFLYWWALLQLSKAIFVLFLCLLLQVSEVLPTLEIRVLWTVLFKLWLTLHCWGTISYLINMSVPGTRISVLFAKLDQSSRRWLNTKWHYSTLNEMMWTAGIQMKWVCDHRSESQFKQLQKSPKKRKDFGASTGFEPMASVLALQCSTSLSYEDPYAGGRPIYWVHQPVKGMKHRMKWCELREYKWNEYSHTHFIILHCSL